MNKDVIEIDEAITLLTGQINECQRNLAQIESEGIDLIKSWIHQTSDLDEKLEIIKNINRREREEDKKYVALRKEKDEKIRQLRTKYMDIIKKFHIEQQQQQQQQQQNQQNVNLQSITLHNSSLLSGNSHSSLDDVDYGRIFKRWEISEEETPVTFTMEKNGRKFSSQSYLGKSYYGSVVRGMVLGREVCVKIFSPKNISREKIEEISRKYYATKKIIGHPNLLSPIGASLKPGEEKILMELARNKYHSLKNVLDDGFKLGFMKKLHIAKTVCGALSWLHESEARVMHGRLKPSNILFGTDWKVKV